MTKIPDSELGILMNLYYGQKMSMSEVADYYKVPIDCVSYFMRKHDLERRSFSEANQVNFEKKPLSYEKIMPVTEDDKILEVIGAMLYWAEGYKKGNAVDFANSDPQMIRIFLTFLRKVFKVDESKLRIYLYCYANQDVQKLIMYWSEICGIPPAQFTQPYVREDFNLGQVGKMEFGMIHVRYADKKLLAEIMRLIHGYSGKFASF